MPVPLCHLLLSLSSLCRADRVFEKQLVSRLRGIMLHEDLEEVTSRQLRGKLEEQLEIQLTEYREFLDRHMLQILGQLEQPSKILDYLYLVCESYYCSGCMCLCVSIYYYSINVCMYPNQITDI